jgi:hypothetical protein
MSTTCQFGTRRPFYRAFVMASLAASLGPRMVIAQPRPPELFTPVANNRIANASADQNRRLEQIRARPTTQSVSLMRINLDALKGNELRIAIPGVAAFDISKTGGDLRTARDFTWSGSAPADHGANATVVVRNGDVTGSITSPAGLYRITPVGNGVHALVKVDTKKLPPEEPPSIHQKEQRPQSAVPRPADVNLADTGTTQIDVLVAYTPAAKAAVDDIDATIALAVAEANQSYVNSNINIRLNLVDTLQVAYTESGKTFDKILADFVANPVVNQHRDQSAADLSAMIINQTDYCGLADDIMAKASTSFAIVHYDCATGYYSFAHELGHLMGARHNEQADSSTSPFAYGHGLQHRTPAPTWRTVMAYVDGCPGDCNRLQYWSNPDVKYNGYAMGTAATNNNARVLNETRATVAGFRVPSLTQFPVWGVASASGKQSGTPNWGSSFDPAQKWFDVNIQGENYHYLADTTLVTPSVGTGAKAYCTSGSVSNKLLIECFDGAGNAVAPVSFGFATFKQPGSSGAYQGPLAFGVISSSGKKESGTTNWTASFNAAAKQYDIAISGENYFYLSYATIATPSFATGAKGYCTTGSVNNKLVVKCYDCNGNAVAPVSFSFATFKGAGAYQKPLAFGVVSSSGKKESGTANWSTTLKSAAKQYEVAITGESYFYLSYATVVTPSFGTGAKGYCTTGSVGNKLMINCFDKTGNAVIPVSFGFATFKK